MQLATVMIIAVALAAALWALRRKELAEPSRRSEAWQPERGPLKPLSTEPDTPGPFGYKGTWLAIRTGDSLAVIKALGLAELQPANWDTGLPVGPRGTFVSPPLSGWVLVVTWDLPELDPRRVPGVWESFMRRLAEQFREVHYYSTHRVVGYHAWAKWVDGRLVRAYAYLGEAGEVLADEGERTPEEVALDHKFSAAELAVSDDSGEVDWESLPRSPEEDDVLDVAARWSLDTRTLDQAGFPPSVGWFTSVRPADLDARSL